MKRLLLWSQILALLLAACATSPPPTPDPLAAYLPDFDPAILPADVDIEDFPRYDISLQVDPGKREVDGTARIHLRNLSGRPLNDVYVRLYPNLPQLVGGMRFKSVVTLPDRFAAGYAFALQNTAIRITLIEPLPPDESLDLEIRYLVKAPHREGYVLFGESEGVLSLPYSYPILAAQTRDPTSPWRLDVPPPHGDITISDPSFFTVTATVPSTVTLIATGVEISRTESSPGWTQHVFVTGPVREWSMMMGEQFRRQSLVVDGVTINSYYLANDERSGRSALAKAASVLRVYNRLLGPYPYKELDIVEAPTRYLGMEYSGLNFIGLDTYRNQIETQEILIAHEIAHQWWYNLVGSDPFRYPWLDEGLAEHSSMLYVDTLYGKEEADRIRALRWQIPIQWAKDNGYDDVVGQEVTAFNGTNYETLVYAKSASFFDAVYQQVGRETYLKILQTFIERYRFKTPTPEDFLDTVREVSGYDPQPLYEKWILSAERKPLPSPTPSPTPAGG
ncbi:MAG: M1 family peptidase [Caldilineae bacterium]|nr:MAG: M1 family peptidase [Caldilineae bacterium]